ncbi:heat shock 70 kDa protein 12A-like [Mytilus galloprovincialis]|uniref:heat shock 70 kDa protein 12A-like n=1 Tax=Mytilus galloprovincialis TaxID=29158 RepID=UPI003F7CB54F
MSIPVLMVAAIDLGTTFSGYAFSMKAEFENNPLQINANQAWKPGNPSIKCPTCILFDENKKVLSFGYDAEDDYTNIVLDKTQNEYYFFKNFKMNLYKIEVLTNDSMIEDVAGKPLLAKTVIVGSLKSLKDNLLENLESKGLLGRLIQENEIRWVLTIPSIWTEPAKKFMRTCAVKAGLGHNPIIALEPEAASIFCQCVPFSATPSLHLKFMIVDIGGGTTDIVIQEKLKDGRLKDLCKPCGDECGGTNVDKEFMKVVSQILGNDVMLEFKRDYPLDYLDIRRTLELLKHTDPEKRIRMSVPLAAFDKICSAHYKKNFIDTLKQSKHKDTVTHVTGEKVQLSKELFLSLFSSTTSKIVNLIKENLKNPKCKDLSMLLLVGGFSESVVVQNTIKKAFPDKTVIIIPDSSTAVLRGAVMYGHNPNIIASRIVKHSYGISSSQRFDPSKHQERRADTVDGVKRCRDTFHSLISANTPVVVGEKRSHTFHTIQPFQDIATFRLFSSPHENPVYIDDKDCRHFADFKIDIQNPSKDRIDIDVNFQFGLTELAVTAKQKGTENKSNILIKYK